MYFFFSIISLFYFYYSISTTKYYFHIFLSLFLFLGFWFKYSLMLVFRDSVFQEGVGNFNFTKKSLDDVLIISAIAILAFLLGFVLTQLILSSIIN